jgi:acyl-CoA synthetase (AMP-forming)/AMP-acid ligase II
VSFLDLLQQPGLASAPALVYEGATLSRDQLATSVLALADRLARAGVGPGSKVLVALPNSPAFLQSLLALNQRRAVFMPLNPGLAPDERRRIDEIARPDFVISEQGALELLPGAGLTPVDGPPPHEDEDEDEDEDEELNGLTAIIFTSGTTGTPKGVMMTEAAVLANARSVAGYLELSDRDRTLTFLPLYYTYTLSQVLSTWLSGGSIVLMRNLFYPRQAFEAIAQHGVTGFGGVPASLNILAAQAAGAGRELGSLRYILSAGGPLRRPLAESVQQAFPGAALFNNYGCTEIGPRATAVDYRAHPDRIGSIGRAIAGVDVSIVRADLSIAGADETGEIVLRGPSLMKGYYRAPEATAARMSPHGFHTGDYASADRDGFLYYQGRRDDIFKSAGEKISAQEIEEVVLQHEAVSEAAVVSLADPRVEAVPVAYIVLRPGASCTERELQTFCGGRLSRRKVPRAVHFVEALSKTASGKIQKYRLRDLAS